MDAVTQPLQSVIGLPEQAPARNTLTLGGTTSTLDPYTDEALLKPWPLYRELR